MFVFQKGKIKKISTHVVVFLFKNKTRNGLNIYSGYKRIKKFTSFVLKSLRLSLSLHSHVVGKHHVDVHVGLVLVGGRALDALVLALGLAGPGVESVATDDELSRLVASVVVVSPKV